ncbi:MAG: hypothetical protein HN348_00225 [Proteobacteria bacterium]|nr:hypothetical protein [Pseudomonadota bacterium]
MLWKRSHLGRLFAGSVLLGLLWSLWTSPYSPAAFSRADAALAAGQPLVAVARYDAIAQSSFFESQRRVALHRSANVWAVELANPEQAQMRLETLVQMPLPQDELASVQASLAALWVEEREILSASQAFLEAFETAPTSPHAASRLINAARLSGEAGKPKMALELWTRLGFHFPDHGPLAAVGQGEIHLAEGDVQAALSLFEDASHTAINADLEAVARLGAATCLERLGNLDGALAEMDFIDLPEEVLLQRREGIRHRQSIGGGAF